MADNKKKDSQAQDGADKKANPWIPVAVIVVIVALIGVMALMTSNSNKTSTDGTNQAATGTEAGAEDGEMVDVSWITLDMTPNQIAAQSGIPAKMMQQIIEVDDAGMDKPLSELGGAETLEAIQAVVGQFGGGMGDAASDGSSTEAPAGMGQ
jgi:hypothetical protein